MSSRLYSLLRGRAFKRILHGVARGFADAQDHCHGLHERLHDHASCDAPLRVRDLDHECVPIHVHGDERTPDHRVLAHVHCGHGYYYADARHALKVLLPVLLHGLRVTLAAPVLCLLEPVSATYLGDANLFSHDRNVSLSEGKLWSLMAAGCA